MQEIEVLRNMYLGENISNCQQQIDEATEQGEIQLPEGVDVKDSAVTGEQRNKLKEFLS